MSFGSKLPKISIVTVVYNCAPYIEACLQSVLNQEYSNLEYIVIDGGSTDGTLSIIEKYSNKLSYRVSEKDRGQTHALNKGFAKATGDVVAWLNADEEYLPGTLLNVGQLFVDTADLDFYFGTRIVVDSQKREIGRKKWPPIHPKWTMLYRDDLLPSDASFWSMRVHRLTGELDADRFPKLGMDNDWFLRLSFNIKKWRCTSRPFSLYVVRDDSASIYSANQDPEESRSLSRVARCKVIKEHNIGRLQLIFGWLIAGLWSRLWERRFSWPHLHISLGKLLSVKKHQ